jgi:hypothetical protein
MLQKLDLPSPLTVKGFHPVGRYVGVHKPQEPGYLCEKILNGGTKYWWVLSMELSSYYLYGA